MVTKTKSKAPRGLHRYRVRGVKGERTTITARNVQSAVNKVSRMYPRTRILGVERISRSGREYETTWVKR